MTYEDLRLHDAEILATLDAARRTGALVMVHCENEDAIRYLIGRHEADGDVAPEGPCDDAADRGRARGDAPGAVAGRDRRRADRHRPCLQPRGDGGDRAGRASAAARSIGETCPQYLMLTADDLDGMDWEGAKFVCSPPPRDKAEPGRLLGRASSRASSTSSPPTTARSATTIREGKLNPTGQRRLPPDPERHSGRRDAAADPVFRRRDEGPDRPQRASSR